MVCNYTANGDELSVYLCIRTQGQVCYLNASSALRCNAFILCKALWIVLYMKCSLQINLTWPDWKHCSHRESDNSLWGITSNYRTKALLPHLCRRTGVYHPNGDMNSLHSIDQNFLIPDAAGYVPVFIRFQHPVTDVFRVRNTTSNHPVIPPNTPKSLRLCHLIMWKHWKMFNTCTCGFLPLVGCFLSWRPSPLVCRRVS